MFPLEYLERKGLVEVIILWMLTAFSSTVSDSRKAKISV
jgi:hypothetical protein